MKRLLCLIPVSLLVGCASMSEEECLTADWKEVGYSDAASGYESSRIGSHREACAPAGVSVDLKAYRLGYDIGLDSYCTEVTGFESGANGHNPAAQCGATRFPGYASGYEQGCHVHELEVDRDQLLARLDDANEEVDDLIGDIAKNESALEAKDLSKDERRKLERASEKMKAALRDTYAEIEDLEERAEALQQEADAVRAGFLRI